MLALKAAVVRRPSAVAALVAFVPLALSLIIAAPIWIGQRYLSGQADILSFEMDLARFDTHRTPESGWRFKVHA